MATPSPADELAQSIALTGARYAFGVPGGGPNLDVVGALGDHDIEFVLGHHETATAIMASTYGYVSDTITAVLVTRGPGAAAVVNGAAQATLDRHPLLVVTDTVPTTMRARVPHQLIDQQAMLAPVTVAAGELGAEAPLSELRRAIAMAATGAVHLDYDATTIGCRVERHRNPLPPPPSVRPFSTIPESVVSSSSRPVVIVGLGAVPYAEELRPVLEALGAPVLTTYQGIGVLPTESNLNAGLFTNGASEKPLLDSADLIIALGLDMVEPIPKPWICDAPVISIAPRPTISAYLPLVAELVGSVDVLADEVLASINHTWAVDAAEQHRERVRAELADHGQAGFGPIELVTTAREHCPAEATVTVDAGAHFLAIMPLWPVGSPKQLLISNGLATMGYAIPAAIGAALARPGTPVVALVGDGGLSMTLAELETVARLDLPITVIVFNDAALSLIEIKQQPQHGGTAAVKYLPTDYAATATAHGMAATTVASADELATALAALDFASPHLIDARIDPRAYPHLIRVTRG